MQEQTVSLDGLTNMVALQMKRKLGGEYIAEIFTGIIRDKLGLNNSVSFIDDGRYQINELRY